MLNSSLKNTKKLSDPLSPEFPKEVFTWLVNVTKEILLDISTSPQNRWFFIPTCTLLDSDASVIFIDKAWVKEKKLPLWPLHHAIPIFNVDGTKNSTSNVTHYVDITISYQGHCKKMTAKVTDLSKNQMILGFTWLQKHNPEIDWKHSTVKMTQCLWSCYFPRKDCIPLVPRQWKARSSMECLWSLCSAGHIPYHSSYQGISC